MEDKVIIDPKDYIKKHKLDMLVTEMYNTLLYERTNNPQMFMVS